jgi:hypothetical protein
MVHHFISFKKSLSDTVKIFSAFGDFTPISDFQFIKDMWFILDRKSKSYKLVLSKSSEIDVHIL